MSQSIRDELTAKSVAMPFCCERCRQIDLGRWLNEEHSLPWEPEVAQEGARQDDSPDDDAG